MDNDDEAMKRRDAASAAGAKICPCCTGSGLIESNAGGACTCPICQGETWVDADGKPLKIDPLNVRITYSE